MPVNNFLICDTNIDLGYEDNIFSMPRGNVHDYVPLGYFRGHDSFIDHYCICIGDLPKKIMWTTFFNSSYEFSEVFDKVKRILVNFGVAFAIASYLLFSKL